MGEGNQIKILFVINPGSGTDNKTDWEKSIADYFQPLGIEFRCHVLDESFDTSQLNKEIREYNPSKVVAVGGDGTVSLIAKQLVGTGRALGILPAGSANGMAKELGLPVTAPEAMALVANGNIRDTDVIKINEKYICLHLSDIGLNAKLIKHFEEGKFRGKFGYATKLIKTLWTRSSMRANITSDGKQISHVAFMVVIANARMYGTGAVINPEGNIYDGKFEVVIVRRIAISEILKMLFKPQPFNPKKIRLFPATAVSITTNRAVHFQVDGEYLGKVKSVEATIMKGQLKLIVP